MWSAPPLVPFEELQRTFAARYPASDPLDLGEGTVVVLFPDFGDRYLSTNLWRGWPSNGSQA